MENSKDMKSIYSYTVVSKTILADRITPVEAYMSLRDVYPQSCLMESSDYHGNENSRSFIGINPIAEIRVSHGKIIASYPDGTTEVRDFYRSKSEAQDYKDTISLAFVNFISRFSVQGSGAEYYGLYGYTSFDAIRYFEPIDISDTTVARNDAADILYILYRDVVVFDHFSNRLTILSLFGEEQIDYIEQKLSGRTSFLYPFRAIGSIESPLTDQEHEAAIAKCIKHCLRGDVFQIVFSRRFVQRYEGDEFQLYRALRSVNPSPYLFYFDFGGYRIFGSSPETHLCIKGTKAWIDPIAGTTKRTGKAEQDAKNANFLRNDPKENAEHVMLVDLARNDLSRTCMGVGVDFYKDMQYYSHVIHLVSRVSGQLHTVDKDYIRDKFMTFFNTFPAGTLSGAPKVRAMQIINELEPHTRGAYGGCIGFIGLNGDMNQAIVIRTFIARNNELWLQAGSGVVAQSNENYEVEECKNKLGALRKAIEFAEKI